MTDITSLTQPVSRSQFYAFAECYPLPSGDEPYLYTRYFTTGATFKEHEVAIDVILTGLRDVSDTTPNIGIRGYVNDLETGPEIRYRLDCDCDAGNAQEMEDWMVGVFNGVVEELDSFEHLTVSDMDDTFENWGVSLEGAVSY